MPEDSTENAAVEEPVLITVEEAARRLSISRGTAYELVLTGRLRSVKIKRARRVPVAAVHEYVAALLAES